LQRAEQTAGIVRQHEDQAIAKLDLADAGDLEIRRQRDARRHVRRRPEGFRAHRLAGWPHRHDIAEEPHPRRPRTSWHALE
jgi:hypothetical protein